MFGRSDQSRGTSTRRTPQRSLQLDALEPRALLSIATPTGSDTFQEVASPAPTLDSSVEVAPADPADSGKSVRNLDDLMTITTLAAPRAAGRAAPSLGGLNGQTSGHYFVTNKNPWISDQPAEFRLRGSGDVQHMGRVSVRGKLTVGGFIAPGTPQSGTITLSNARGSVTLTIEGQLVNALDGSTTVNAIVSKGTGRYANLRGLGDARLEFGSVAQVMPPAGQAMPAGSFVLALNLAPPRR